MKPEILMSFAKRKRMAFTLIELLVVIAIIAILAAILFPVFAQARAKARQTACLSNMKQMGTAMMMYAQDYEESYPILNLTYSATNPAPNYDILHCSWVGHLYAYTKNTEIFACPDAVMSDNSPTAVPQSFFTLPGPGGVSAGSLRVPRYQIGANEFVVQSVDLTGTSARSPLTFAEVSRPADLPVFADSVFILFNRMPRVFNANYNHPGTGAYEPPATVNEKMARHNGGSNLVFGDGHAKWLPQRGMDIDPNRSSQTQVWRQYKIPMDPYTDDRLK